MMMTTAAAAESERNVYILYIYKLDVGEVVGIGVGIFGVDTVCGVFGFSLL